MPPIVPVGLEEEPPSDSDNDFYSEDELPNFALQEDIESDSSQSPVPGDEDENDPDNHSLNVRYSINYAYELLPQEPESHRQDSEINTDVNLSLQSAEEITAGDNTAASTEPPEVRTLHMDSDQIEKIKAVMANVTLPTSAFPTWASDIPEDSWKDHLISRMQAGKTP